MGCHGPERRRCNRIIEFALPAVWGKTMFPVIVVVVVALASSWDFRSGCGTDGWTPSHCKCGQAINCDIPTSNNSTYLGK